MTFTLSFLRSNPKSGGGEEVEMLRNRPVHGPVTGDSNVLVLLLPEQSDAELSC